MRFRLLVFLIAAVLFYSCDQDFNPYGEYHEKYVFTCILKSDKNFQTAYISHSYRPEGVDPYTNTTDPAVDKSDVRVWYNNSVYVFRDTLIERTDTSRYKDKVHIYYNNQFAIQSNETIELEVILPGGKRLRSSSVTPNEIYFEDESETVIPPVGKNVILLAWRRLIEDNFYSARLTIKYLQNIDGEVIPKTKVVPLSYVMSSGEEVPFFPYPSSVPYANYELDAVTHALEEISEGDPNKQNYSVYSKISFDVTTYDLPASRYVSSVSGSVDDLTVSESVSDYTNIDGGLGIFGSYSKKNYDRLRFLQSYIESLGYNYINQN